MNKEELVNQVKRLIGPDAEGVTVMWCADRTANAINLTGDEGMIAAEIVQVLKHSPITASIVKNEFKKGGIGTDPKLDDLVGFASELLDRIEED